MNLRPSGYEPDELPDCSTPQQKRNYDPWPDLLQACPLNGARGPWLRGEPRWCGDRAHRLVAPSLAPTGERRPSMACLRPIPAPPRLSPPVCPWLRRCRLRHVPPKRKSPRRQGRRCLGSPLAACSEQRVARGQGATRAAAAPHRSEASGRNPRQRQPHTGASITIAVANTEMKEPPAHQHQGVQSVTPTWNTGPGGPARPVT